MTISLLKRLKTRAIESLADAVADVQTDRDWQALTEENETLRERIEEQHREIEKYEAEAERGAEEISLLQGEVAHLRKSEKDARAEAMRTYEEVVRLRKLHHCEPDSMRGSLMAIVEACDRHLPRELFNDTTSPLILAARTIRNLAQRGLQNDPTFMRDEKARQEAEKPIELDDRAVYLRRDAMVPGHETGEKLDAVCFQWGFTRKPGEPDDTFRSRVLAAMAAGFVRRQPVSVPTESDVMMAAAKLAVGVDAGAVGGDLFVERAPNNAVRILREERLSHAPVPSVATRTKRVVIQPEAGSCVPGSDPGTTEPPAPVEFEPEDSDENGGH